MDIEPLQTILSITNDKKDTLLHFLKKEVREKVIHLEYEEHDFYMNDRIFCIKKNNLELELVGRIISIDGNRLGVKRTSTCTIYIDSSKYYIFVKYLQNMSQQRDFLQTLLEQL
jgi:hypothetical protein